jgi:GNAT superfamily N-acetyltransferase
MFEIRPFRDSDWSVVWPLLRDTFAAGETYSFAPDLPEGEARRIWIDLPAATFVTVDDGKIVGTYFIKPNQPGLGAHVCNCGYVVDPLAQGKGIAARLGYVDVLVMYKTLYDPPP